MAREYANRSVQRSRRPWSAQLNIHLTPLYRMGLCELSLLPPLTLPAPIFSLYRVNAFRKRKRERETERKTPSPPTNTVRMHTSATKAMLITLQCRRCHTCILTEVGNRNAAGRSSCPNLTR